MLGNVDISPEIGIKDISAGGICFITTKRLNPANKCVLKLRHNDVQVMLNCVVIWSALRGTEKIKGEMAPLYEIGAEFNNLTESTAKRLEKLIAGIDETDEKTDTPRSE
jgi:hypothetical protein